MPTIRRAGNGTSNDFSCLEERCSHSHHRPGLAGRFLGRCGEGEERLRPGAALSLPLHLWWRLGDLDPRLRGGLERRADSSRSDSGMSNTTGGRSARLVAAASGRAAPISKWTSGRAARGWVCAGPDLGPPAIRASL